MIKSIGIIEMSGVAAGMEACDILLKRADIKLIRSQPMCPGKYVIIYCGDLSSVNEALSYLKENFTFGILDGIVIGNIAGEVINAMMGCSGSFRRDAVGVVETYTVAAAIKAADTGIKAADVDIVDLRTAHGMGGKGFVLMSGTVSAVTAAVEAGASEAAEEGMLAARTVIAAPDERLWNEVLV